VSWELEAAQKAVNESVYQAGVRPPSVPAGATFRVNGVGVIYLFIYLILATKHKASSRRDMYLKQCGQRKGSLNMPASINLHRCAVRKSSGAGAPPVSGITKRRHMRLRPRGLEQRSEREHEEE
jgi:hypothetical protein